MIQFDEHIFQRGWNHQLDFFWSWKMKVELLLFFFGGEGLNGVKMVRYPNISIDNSPRYMECRFLVQYID